MADDTDTPTPTDAKKPAATRRRAPRKTTATGGSSAAKKPAARKPATKRAATAVVPAANAAAPASTQRKSVAAKPRAAARPKPVAPRRAPVSASQPKASTKKAGKWGTATIAGGIAAVGAVATAALLSLRGSTPKDKPAPKGSKAHQPDGEDSSKSFEAGIADENTIPDKN